MMTFLVMAMIVVAGGPDDETVWRGWPVHVRADANLKVSGPSEVAIQRGREGWVVKPQTTATLSPGQYRFAVGEESFTVTVADPPATLSPADIARRQQIEMWCAAETGDVSTAERLVAAMPHSVTALAALGVARYAAGDLAGAFKACQQAIPIFLDHHAAVHAARLHSAVHWSWHDAVIGGLTPDQIRYTLNHAEAKAVLIHRDFLPNLEAPWRRGTR